MSLRGTNLEKLADQTFEVLILGGGINGAVCAAALAARGAKVALIDRADFAAETSSQSSNLAWGGIKYLETMEFGLVYKLCRARNLLLRSYPSTVQEIRFFVTHERGFRHGLWKLLAGAFLYWAIGGFFTRRPRLLTVKTVAKDEPIIARGGIDGGFEYSDAFLHDNDARFTWGFIRSALDHGCIAANYVSAGAARRAGGLWVVDARDEMTGRAFTIRARALVNACGPWADLQNERSGQRTQHQHVLSKGIHLLVRRLTPSNRVITFFADDGRLFFVIPMGPRTCIGTTDTRVERPETEVTDEDRRFVLDNVNKRLQLDEPLGPEDIIAERCGVRPLVVKTGYGGARDWMQLSRKHVIEENVGDRVLTIFGGKLTDCLNVGEEVCAALTRMGLELPYAGRRWFGEPDRAIRDEFFHQARLMELDKLTSPQASEVLSTRLWRRYGPQAFQLLEAIRADVRMADLLIEHAEYLRCEIELAARREMITRLDDFLRRRSKISQVVSREAIRRSAGLTEACRILFGADAEARLREAFPEGVAEAEPAPASQSA
jgi:glycerol-3-phosphate dehydrogenase